MRRALELLGLYLLVGAAFGAIAEAIEVGAGTRHGRGLKAARSIAFATVAWPFILFYLLTHAEAPW